MTRTRGRAGRSATEDGLPRRPPYRVRTERLHLRPYGPEDAPALRDALAANRGHLFPWLPWVEEEPTGLARKLDRVLRFRAAFDRAEDFTFAAFDAASGALVGSTGLHLRVGPGAAEIGYWIDRARTGRGLATEAAAAMVAVGFEDLALDRIEIRCDPANTASLRVAEHLAFRHEGDLRENFPNTDGTRRDTRLYALVRSEYTSRESPRVVLERHDALGRALPLTAPDDAP